MTADAPLGEIVAESAAGTVPKEPDQQRERAERPESNWQSSSYALLSGCQVKDYTERIPDRVFDALFKD